jgi:glyoxylase-like metal-dependent hydrolase (beta-lactamase superfamily II)
MRVTILIDGFPGMSATHGGFGWCSVALIECDGQLILVETGPPAYIPLLKAKLEARNIQLGDITGILITHAHWDHLANVTMFPNADFYIGAREIEWARQLPAGTPFVSSLHVDFLLANSSRVNLVHDGDGIVDGVEVIGTPGHTPGHVAYMVTGETTYFFAGDAVKNLHELSTGKVDSTLSSDTSEKSVEKLYVLTKKHGALLIPGHDVPLYVDSSGSVKRAHTQRVDIQYYATARDRLRDVSISIA